MGEGAAMRMDEAGAIIFKLLKSYPNQRRDKEFQEILATELVTSGLSFSVVARRASQWIRTEQYWPAISDLVGPEEEPAPRPKLIAPQGAIPNSEGIKILRSAVSARGVH